MPWARADLGEVEAVLPGEEAVAVRAEAEERIDHALGTEAAQLEGEGAGLLGEGAAALGDEAEAEVVEDVPVVAGVRGGREDGLGPLDGVAHGEGVQDDVVVAALDRWFGGRTRCAWRVVSLR